MIGLTVPEPADMSVLAGAVWRSIEPGDVVVLDGQVGAGKTTFVRGVAEAAGVTEPVRSPTYTIAHDYRTADGTTIAHLDLYRHETAMDVEAWADIEPHLDAALTCIEWPGAGVEYLEAHRVWIVKVEIGATDTRSVWIDAPDAAAAERLRDEVGAWAS